MMRNFTSSSTFYLQRKAIRRRKILDAAQIAGSVFVTAVFLFPLYWMITSSLKTSSELLSSTPTLIPKAPTFENYVLVWQRVPWMVYIGNTVVVTLSIVLVKIVTGILAAYSFAIGQYRFRDVLFVLVLGAMMIPIQITFIPIYVMFSTWGLTNTYLGIILPSAVSAYSIFMLRNHFKSVDNSYIEAGKIDGMGRFRIILNVLIPMCKPGVVTMIMLDVIEGWNMYFWPKIITSKDQYRLVTTGLTALKASFLENPSEYFNQIMAGTMITILPIVIMFIVCQKYILTGFSKAAMK